MKYVIERAPVSPTVDELVFLAADGFHFTVYVDAADTQAAIEARRAFLVCLAVKNGPEPLEPMEDFA